MSKRHILVFANSDYEDTPYDQWLPPSEYELHILTSTEKADGYGHLPAVHAFDDYARNGQVEAHALRIARRYACAAVLARAEVDVLRAARIRDVCGIRGQGWTSALAFRDKVIMKRYVRESRVEIPAYVEIDTAIDLILFAEEHGYPLVVKPRRSSGSVGTSIVHTEDELERLLATDQWRGFEVETFVDGTMYHVDGLIIDSKVVFVCVSRYINGCLAWRDNDFCGSVVVGDESPLKSRLVEATEQVLAAMPDAVTATFHAEFFHTPQDELVFCEIASRTGGGRINDAIAAAHGFNLDEQWVRAQCGLPVLPPLATRDRQADTAGFVLIPPAQGVLLGLPDEPVPDWVAATKLLAKVGQRYGGGEKSGHYIAAYVVTGANEDIAASRVEQIARWFQERTRWEITPELTQ